MLLPLVSTLFPYTTLFRSVVAGVVRGAIPRDHESPDRRRRRRDRDLGEIPPDAVLTRVVARHTVELGGIARRAVRDRKSTRLNSSHLGITYAVFCLKNKIQ